MRQALIVPICLILFTAFVTGGAQSQHRTAPLPRAAPQPKPKPATRPVGVKAYENAEYHFSFKVPANWTESSDAGAAHSFSIPSEQGKSATFQIHIMASDAGPANVDEAVEMLNKKYSDAAREVRF